MVARLWWKDARQFWPIWALLAVVALAVQALALHYEYAEARQGGMAVAALFWSCLYGFAVAAAAFAGERENRTLGLLDALPVERWRLWLAKSSFALVSTLALGLVLFAAASLVTDRWQIVTPGRGLVSGALVLLTLLCWGLLWSAATSNALLAAVLAISSAFLILPLSDMGFELGFRSDSMRLLTIAIGFVALIGSAFLFIRSGPPRRPLLGTSARSLVPRRTASRASTREVTQSPPRFWPAAVRSLTWQTLRDVRSVGAWLALLALVMLVFGYLGRGPGEELAAIVCSVGAVILAGISVFGTEHRARTQTFLTNQGAEPHLVWLVKIGSWLAAIATLGVLIAVVTILGIMYGGVRSIPILNMARGVEAVPDAAALILGHLALPFAVATLCGMVIRRGITAWLVTVVFWFLLVVPLGWLSALNMMPVGFLWLLPLALLAVSLAWSPDWMLDRPGVRRWIKLALLLAGSLTIVVAGYASYRVASVPSLDPVREAELFTFTTPVSVPDPENAAGLWRKAISVARSEPEPAQLQQDVNRAIEEGWDPKAEGVIRWYRERADDLARIRAAAAPPYCRLEPLEKLTVFNPGGNDLPALYQATRLLALSVRERESRGDLEGAWNELLVMFRMSRQWMGAVPLRQAYNGLTNEYQALSLAMTWAADSRQTAGQLRAALDAYRKLPPLPSAADPIRAEAQVVRNTEQLPRSEIVEGVLLTRMEPRSHPETLDKLWTDVVTTPWELARAGKAFRLLYGSKIEGAQTEPWLAGRTSTRTGTEWLKVRTTTTPNGRIVAPAELEQVFESTPLVKFSLAPLDNYLYRSDRNEVGRRALVQILALRAWQLEHGGRLPERLEDLVSSSLLDSLPADPYAPPYKPRHHFGYVRASGQLLLPLGRFWPLGQGTEALKQLRPAGQARLLYSVGPDLQDDGASRNDQGRDGGDIIFPLAESPKGGR